MRLNVLLQLTGDGWKEAVVAARLIGREPHIEPAAYG
jgi:hypothetical protein